MIQRKMLGTLLATLLAVVNATLSVTRKHWPKLLLLFAVPGCSYLSALGTGAAATVRVRQTDSGVESDVSITWYEVQRQVQHGRSVLLLPSTRPSPSSEAESASLGFD
jgi:hypothetical protein